MTVEVGNEVKEVEVKGLSGLTRIANRYVTEHHFLLLNLTLFDRAWEGPRVVNGELFAVPYTRPV